MIAVFSFAASAVHWLEILPAFARVVITRRIIEAAG